MTASSDDEQAEAPETEAPETEAPETEAPETEAPETEAPETEAAEMKADEISTIPSQKKPKGIKEEIKQIADDFVIPISEQAINAWAKNLDKDTKPFKKYAEQVACGLYPTLASQIEMGIPTRILLDPYIQVAQQVLGSVMTEPNWTDPKWSKALQGGVDPKTGRPVPMVLDDWKNFLMNEPGHNWEFSQMAHERVAAFGKALHRSFMGQDIGGPSNTGDR